MGTSSKDNTLPLLPRRAKTNVRELGAQLGSSPSTSGVAEPPPAGTTQISNPLICAVNAIHFPSGDQSGSVGFAIPLVGIRTISPPSDGTLYSPRRPVTFVAKQIHRPSGDHVGDDASPPLVSFFKFVPSASHTQISGLPDLPNTIATRPSRATAALLFMPP